MKHYYYSGQLSQGTAIQGWVAAENREEALERLRQRDIQAFSVRAGSGEVRLTVPAAELLVALRELASLRRSGMPIDQSVQAVIDTTEHAGLNQSWQQVKLMLRSGMSLSDAFGSLPGTFPGYMVPLVRLGEATGKLAEAVNIAADRLEEQTELKGDIRSALTYPAFLMVVSVAVLVFLFSSVIPRFGDMVSGDQSAGSALSMLLGISEFLREFAWLWIALAVAAVTLFALGWRSGQVQKTSWALLQRVPGIATIVEAWTVVQFTSCMSSLLKGGVGMIDAIKLSAEAVGRSDVRGPLERVANFVSKGDTLGNALAEVAVFPGLVVQMIAVGERSANLALTMEEIARLYRRRMKERIERALSLLEPAVIVLMGVMVGGIMISLLSAIVSMNDLPL